MIYVCELVGGPEDGRRIEMGLDIAEIRIPTGKGYLTENQELETWKMWFDPENFRYDLYRRVGSFKACAVHTRTVPHVIARFQLVASGITQSEELDKYADPET